MRVLRPVAPRVTFDHYVIPHTVREYVKKVPRRMNLKVLVVSAFAVLTVLLASLLTLKLMGPRFAVMAAADRGGTALVGHDVTVTRAQTTDILAPSGTGRGSAPQIDDLKTVLLDGLGPLQTDGPLAQAQRDQSVQQALRIISRNKLRMLREGVLAGVYTIETRTEEGQKRIVLKTINADLTSSSMANLLRQAASDGKIDMPQSLNTADGDVDMDTLIFNLVQTSLANDGTPEGAEAARELSRKAFAASSAKTREVNGERVYVVQPGDSLANISLQFYGRPGDFERIFRANRSLLSSPDKIQTGQRLIIPS